MSRNTFYFIFRLPVKVAIFLSRIWNPIKFRLTGIIIGKNACIRGKIFIDMGKGSQIIIGNNLNISSGLNINPLSRNIRACISAYKGATIKIGNNVGISSACIWSSKSITIGNNVKIGGDSIIIDSDSHSLDYLIRKDSDNKIISKDIIIEDDVWIGTRSIVLKGVTIGARSIIGAGSVVTKDIPTDCIAAGNPCRIIRHLENKNS